jgi:hypothetical protein
LSFATSTTYSIECKSDLGRLTVHGVPGKGLFDHQSFRGEVAQIMKLSLDEAALITKAGGGSNAFWKRLKISFPAGDLKQFLEVIEKLIF